jgi:hypothetical protein
MTAPVLEQTAATAGLGSICKLPPLILHPFSDPSGPGKLIESSRANLKIQGLLPTGESTRDDLDSTLLDGRYSELRMLYYVGKDINRWVDQCMDCVGRKIGNPSDIRPQSFIALLIQNTPGHIREKLQKWGVADYRALFSRGLGLNTMWAAVPDRTSLSDEFIRNYYRYTDQLFTSYQTQTTFAQLNIAHFQFDLYSSGEYSRILERSWDML